MFEKFPFEPEEDFKIHKKAAKEKFSGPPLPGYVRLGVYPPPKLALNELDANKGYGPLIVGDFEVEVLKTKFGFSASEKSLVVSWDDFKASCLPVDPDAPNEEAIMKYFFYEQDNKF